MNRYIWSALPAILAGLLLAGCTDESPEKRIVSAKDYLQKNDTKSAVIEIKNALQATLSPARRASCSAVPC